VDADPATQAAVGLLVAAWTDWTAEPDFPMIEKHCINGTRVAVQALRRLGIKAKPISVGFMLFNKAAHDLMVADVPIARWPEHAHSLGRGPGHNGAPASPGMWDGHLIAEGDGFTLDLSAGAMNRPGKIESKPWVIWQNLPPTGQVCLEQDNGQVMYLERWPANNGWRQSPGWQRLHGAEVDEILRRMNALADRITT
jgi:hypothetical protein